MATPQPKLTIFADKIFYYENVIAHPEDIVYLIEETESELSEQTLISSWHPWHASDNPEHLFGARKTTDEEFISGASDEVKRVYETLSAALDTAGKDYAAKNGIDLGRQAPISISKYYIGASMGQHTDSSPEPTTENMSAVLYLNGDYEGGEINFPQQGVKIKPSAGSLVVFPSVPPFFHESLEIISGTKYMSPAFWHLFPANMVN